MQDKREIGYCVDRLEKTQYFKRVINTIIERVKTQQSQKEDRIKCSSIADLGSELKGLENKELNDGLKKRSSYKERKVNALALGAEEGRG